MYVPEFVAKGPDGVYGDEEKFFASFEKGEQAYFWTQQMAIHEKEDWRYVRSRVGDWVIPGCLDRVDRGGTLDPSEG
jgi:hypothetical protein